MLAIARNMRGFSLIELAVSLLIVGILVSSLLVPIGTQVNQRRIAETEKTLEETKEALIGYALSRDPSRLPCPDKTTSAGLGTPNDGDEDFDPVSGQCAALEGNLPWVTLGTTEKDSWGNRFRYRVTDVFSRRPPAAPMALSSGGNLRVCQTAACAAPRLVDSAPAVVISTGRNSGVCTTLPSPPGCLDERQNDDGDNNFVSRVITSADSSAGEFDDIVVWVSSNVLFNRLVAAGKLP